MVHIIINNDKAREKWKVLQNVFKIKTSNIVISDVYQCHVLHQSMVVVHIIINDKAKGKLKVLKRLIQIQDLQDSNFKCIPMPCSTPGNGCCGS